MYHGPKQCTKYLHGTLLMNFLGRFNGTYTLNFLRKTPEGNFKEWHLKIMKTMLHTIS